MAHILQALLWQSAPFAALAVIGLAWSVAFAASPAAPPSLHHHAVTGRVRDTASFLYDLSAILAMMGPAITFSWRAAATEHAAIRQWRHAAMYFACHLLAWIAFNTVAVTGLALGGIAPSFGPLAGTALAAGAWQVSQMKRRAVRLCIGECGARKSRSLDTKVVSG